MLLLSWLAADSTPAQTVTYHHLGIYLKPHFDHFCKVPLSCSQVLGLYKIICTKEEPGNTGRKMCMLLQCINKQLEFMAGNSKQWGYMQISHSKSSCMTSLFIDVFLLNTINDHKNFCTVICRECEASQSEFSNILIFSFFSFCSFPPF